jgi:hypothetical protein
MALLLRGMMFLQEDLMGILDFSEEHLQVPMTKDFFLEQLLMMGLEDHASLEVLLEDHLDKEHPDLLDAHDGLSDPRVVLDNRVEHASEALGVHQERSDHLIVLAGLRPDLSPQISAHLLVSDSVSQVPVVEHVTVGEERVTKSLVDQEVVVVRVSSLGAFVSNQLLNIINESVADPVHELLNALIKYAE